MPVPIPNQTPIVTFPVPVIADQVLLEFWNTTQADYVPLAPGTPHQNTRDYSGFKLGKQAAVEGTEKMIRRVWVTDATNENLYNYALKYSGQSVSHPIFIRSYRERKDTYVERARGSALQTVYKIKLTAAGTGYTAPTVSFSGGAGSGATATAVLHHDKSIAEIVLTAGGDSYTSAPTVTITDATGSGAAATAYIQSTGAVLVEEEAQQFDPASEYFALYFNVIRVYETLPGPLLSGQNYNVRNGIITPYTIQKTASGVALGNANTEVTPLSTVEDEVRVTTIPSAAILAEWTSIVGTANLSGDLPPVLTGLTVTYNKVSGNGQTVNEAGEAASSGTSGGLNFSPAGSAQGSASITPDVVPFIKTRLANNVPCVNYFFHMEEKRTVAQVLARLAELTGATVFAWPRFVPEPIILSMKGQQVSIEVSARAHHADRWSEDNLSYSVSTGEGESNSNGVTTRTEIIQPTLHAAITIPNPTESGTVNVAAGATIPTITGTGLAPSFVSVNKLVAKTSTANASVSPVNIPATSPANIPLSGLYAHEIAGQETEWDGFQLYRVEVVDMSYFA